MLDTVFEWFRGLYLHLRLTFGLMNDDPRAASFRLTRVSFSPASPATVRVGDEIKVNIFYKSTLKGRLVQIWAQPNTAGFGGTYQPSGMEPANGMVTRTFEVSNEGHLDNVLIEIMHYSGREMLYENQAVDYTLVANPELAALKEDGVGSKVRVREVRMNGMTIRPHAQVRIDDLIEVVIDYRNTAEHEVNLWAIATMDHEVPGRYDSGEIPANKNLGTITKRFELMQPATIDGIYVHMVNVANETIAEQWLDFPIEFVK